MQAESRKGHREEATSCSHIIKMLEPGASLNYDGTLNLLATSLFISPVRGRMDYWSVKRSYPLKIRPRWASCRFSVIDVGSFFFDGKTMVITDR